MDWTEDLAKVRKQIESEKLYFKWLQVPSTIEVVGRTEQANDSKII